MTPLLSQNNEDCVPKVPHLRDVKEPKQICKRRISFVEIVAWKPRVPIAVSQEASLDGHIGTKEDLGNVVNKFDWVRINCWDASFHDVRSNKNEGDVDEGHSDGTTEVTQPPSLHVREMNQTTVIKNRVKTMIYIFFAFSCFANF